MKNPKFYCLGILIFFSCTIKKPVTPSWDTHLEVPLIDKKYIVEEILEDEDNVVIDREKEEVVLNIEKTKTYGIGKFLTATPVWDENQISFTSPVPGSEHTIQDTLVMEDSFVIEEAEFDSGFVKVEVWSPSTIESEIEIPSLSRNGTPFLKTVNVFGGTREESWDLTGFKFSPLVRGNRNVMPYKITVRFLGGVSPLVTVKLDFSKLKYRKITGILNQTEGTLEDTVETGIEVSDEFKGIQIGSALLDFTISNPTQFPGDFDLDLTGISENGETATIRVSESIPARSDTIKTKTYEVRDLINLLPEKLILSGVAKLGDGTTRGTISKDDSITVTSHVQAPLIFSLPAKENKTKVDTIEIEKDTREFIRDNLTSAGLVFEIENFLPIGASVGFYFSRIRGDSSIYDDGNYELLKTISLSPAITDRDPGTVDYPGRVVRSVLDTVSFSLSHQEIQVVDAPEVYMGVRLTFPGTKGVVKIRPTDWIRVRCRIEADVRADFEKEKKGGGS